MRPERSVRKLAVHAGTWSLGVYAAGQMIRLGGNVALSYLLTPAAFGLMQLVSVFAQGLQMFTDIGVGPAIIQNPAGEERSFLRTAWTMQVIRGVVLAIACMLLAWPYAMLYDARELLWLVPCTGVGAVLTGFASTSLFVLNRRLDMMRLGLFGLAEQSLGVAFSIAVALVYPSVAALIVGWLASGLFRGLGSHFLQRSQRDGFGWNQEAAHSLIRFGKWVFLSTVLAFFAGNLDRLLLAKIIPIEVVGVYGMAMSIAMMPNQIASRLSHTVVFPLVARFVRDGQAALEAKVLGARRVVLSGSLAPIICVVSFSPLFFDIVYSDAFVQGGWMAQLIAVNAWLGVLTITADRTLLALGDSRWQMCSRAANLVAGAAGCIGGYQLLGLPGFILGVAFGSFSGHLVVLWRLRTRGIAIWRQDLMYTLAFVVLGAVGALGPHALETSFGQQRLPATLLSAAMAIIPATAWAALVIRRDLIRKRRS